MSARLILVTFAVAAFAVALSARGSADEAGRPIRFAAPKRIAAGGQSAGVYRNFPSPVLYDVDGDKRADMVIGDLEGVVTFARRNADGSFAAETPFLKRDGKPIKFHNW